MLEPKQMSRAVIVGHKSIFEETVDALHKANLFQIEDFNEDESGLRIGRPFENVDEVSKKLIKIRSIASLLGVKDVVSKKQDKKSVLSALDDTLNKLDAELDVKAEQKSKLEAELKEIDSLKKELIPFANISLDFDLYHGYEHLSVFSGYVKEDVGAAVSRITSSYEIFYDAKESTMVLFVTKDKAAEVADLLAGFAFRELRIPNISGMPSESLSRITSKESGLLKQVEAIDAEIESLKDKYAEFILASNEVLSIEAQKSETPLKVATSDSTFIIDGWVPEEDYAELERIVKAATNGRAFVSKQEMTKKDQKIVPIEYNNSKMTAPFQEIMDLYARPTYKELDPTALLFISFPLFYGMILGDIGYALILLAMAIGIKKAISSDAIKPLMNILIYCQISTLIFGVLYGEFLGFPLASLHTEHGVTEGLIKGFETVNLLASPVGDEMITFPVHRTHLVMTMIIATALVGFIHINIGYLLGFINENRKHGISAAIFEKGSWFVIEIGLILAILGYAAVLPSVTTILGVVVFLIGLVMLLKGEGIKGPIELPSLLSNSLSYTRIIAVGLSSIYIASTVNLIAFEMIWEPGTPIGGTTIFAIIVFLLGHGLNTALSIIAPGLHSLRLQYVEFFGKFYEGGGRKYDPFGYIRKYTEE
ncbi:V-type ATP synthase subunit I [Methanolobus mangrovi]|uniref:A-type ATP synthase subunit I n=1 Tax=Methanolobus mangrovi TaxID=3072977 RepID=A0AA51UFM4_9EURY|nr:V-type ATP synthase subunit I [Methanolobus mangrovi]WMW22288.1 V-type ATP synthase subunit I [Methanolobus mangrovi]